MTPVLTPISAAAAGLAVLFLIQIVLLWKLARSTRVTADATVRVSQLTAALALLTDTTEEGFVNVAAELERLGVRPVAAGSTRRATTRRIAAAVRKGKAIEDVAIAESLSESEVRLHVGLEAAAEPVTPREAAVTAKADKADKAEKAAVTTQPEKSAVKIKAEDGPGVLDDIERWMNAVASATQSRGVRHAAVRV
jgi:hypothetical protein